MTNFEAHREPLTTTLARTIGLAVIAGAIASRWWGVSRFPVAVIAALWPSFGGHWVELWFLDWLRPRISPSRGVQIAARLATWFVGGIVLFALMGLTVRALAHPAPAFRLPFWIAGLGFVAIELFVHLGLQTRGRASFFNARS